MKRIELTQNRVALVDDQDYAVLSQARWYAQKVAGSDLYYAKRKVGGRIVAMHTFLLGATSGHIDHIDGNGLNNQRNNLRMATPSQNGGNRKVNANNTTGFKGVCYLSKRNRYAAQIAGKTLGYFRTAKEAAQAYNAAAVSRYGDFAKLNTVE